MKANEVIKAINKELLKMVESGLIEEEQQEVIITMIIRIISNYRSPKIEVVDENHQKCGQLLFHKHKDGHYVTSLGIHKWVCMLNGIEIPEGCDVHHIDEDKSNNDISNLQVLTKAEHKALHNKTAPIKTYICKQCGKSFQANNVGGRKFCSQKCYGAYRRKNGLDNNVIVKCVVCGKEFSAARSDHRKCCSIKCVSEFNKLKDKFKVKCEFCGKEFETNCSNRRFCSSNCARKDWRNRRKAAGLPPT